MDLKDELMTERGQAVGFGQIKVPNAPEIEFNLDVPPFAFVIIERDDDRLRYIASCVELPIDGYGNTVKDAESELYVNICTFLYENFRDAVRKESFCENLYSVIKSNSNSGTLLNKYYALQYLYAKKNVALAEKSNTKSAKKRLAVSSLISVPLTEAVNHTVVEYGAPRTKGKFAFA
jgi:hypothetical protein